MNRPWLASYTWPMVIEINRLLCAPKAADHGTTSDGHEPARAIWEANHLNSMPIVDAVDLCRRCHQIAPFLNYNGNTFVAIIRQVLSGPALAPVDAAVLRSLAGHIVAGTAHADEEDKFRQLLQQISDASASERTPQD